MNRLLVAAAMLCCTVGSVWAHEFWVQPLDGVRGIGRAVEADIRRGENFRGDPLVFNPANFQRVEVHAPSGRRAIEGRLGDRPALRFVPREEGLHILVYVSDRKRTTYTALRQFAAFADYEGLDGAVRRHRARGLPDGVFSEAYTRYAKALVPAGRTAMPDQRIGLPIEIVLDGGTPLLRRGRVWLDGAPMADARVRVFLRPALDDAAPTHASFVTTDAEGRFEIAARPLDRVLLSAVHLREPSAELARTRDVVWETRWASLVFTAPQ